MPAKKPREHGTFPMARECKCDVCTPVRTAKQREAAAKQKADRAAGVPIPDDAHGLNGYSNYRCTCDVCRAAWAEEVARRKAERAARPVPEHVHGTENGYGNYGCRCAACTAFNTTAKNDRRRAAAQSKEEASA